MNPSIEPITFTRPDLSIKIEASPRSRRSISEYRTVIFSIGASCTQPFIRNDRIRILHRFLFCFDHFLRRPQLQTVMDKISSLTSVRDPIFFERHVLRCMSDYCDRATSMYHDHRVEFLVSVESSGPPVQAASDADEVLVSDSAVQGRGTQQRGSTQGIEKLERIEDVSAERSSSGQCAICLEEFGRGNELELGKTPCLHVFHYRFVKRWLERRPTCPLCRADIWWLNRSIQ